MKTGQLLKGHHVTLLGRFGYYQIKLEQSLRVSAACGLSEGRLAIMNSIAVQRSSGQVSTSNAPSVAQQSRQIPVCTPGRNPWLAPWSPVGRSGTAVQSSPAHVRRRGGSLISGAPWTPDLAGGTRARSSPFDGGGDILTRLHAGASAAATAAEQGLELTEENVEDVLDEVRSPQAPPLLLPATPPCSRPPQPGT